MTRRIPIIPTIMVVAAAATMIALGVWQLGRADEKAELIAAYQDALANEEVVSIGYGSDALIYRTVQLECGHTVDWQAIAGRNAQGRTGYAHRYLCPTVVSGNDGEMPGATFVDIGWSAGPTEPDFEGGVIQGVLVPMGDDFKVVASDAPAGLEPLARPNPNDLPNNHLAYAGQWFFFALTALLIYGFALRRKWREQD